MLAVDVHLDIHETQSCLDHVRGKPWEALLAEDDTTRPVQSQEPKLKLEVALGRQKLISASLGGKAFLLKHLSNTYTYIYIDETTAWYFLGTEIAF